MELKPHVHKHQVANGVIGTYGVCPGGGSSVRAPGLRLLSMAWQFR